MQTHAERALEKAWLDIQEHPMFSPDGDSFLMLAPVQEGSRETYTHIKHVTVTQQHIAVLSHGRHEVSKILSWDTVSHLMYVNILSSALRRYFLNTRHKYEQTILTFLESSKSSGTSQFFTL